MPVSCGEVCGAMERIAPPELAESGDNVGLIIGRRSAEVAKILVALDVTEAVVDEAVALGAEMIVSHHPVIYKPVANVADGSFLGRKLLKIIENKINVYSAHTNLDIAGGGTGDTLAELLELENTEKIIELEGAGHIGRAGYLAKPMALRELACLVKRKLGMDAVRYYGGGDSMVSKVGLCPGSGMGYGSPKAARAAGCDVYITGDIGYHAAQDAVYGGLCLIDATHFASEIIIVPRLCRQLQGELNGVRVIQSEAEAQIFGNA